MKRQRIIQILLIMIWGVWGAGELRAQEFMPEVTFEGFTPDSMSVGQQWTLADTRDGKTYRIRLMPDGHYWMVDDLRYGNNPDTCKGKTTFTGCWESIQENAGYFYSWTTAMQQAAPQRNQPEVLTCAGIQGDGKRCKGICPQGWHIPTKDEFDALNAKFQEMGCRHDSCWRATLHWEAVLGGATLPESRQINEWKTGFYWTSTTYGNESPAYLMITKGLVKTTRDYGLFVVGMAVRCMRNY